MKRLRRGFTLLEVMIAMAILVTALAALLGHEGVAIQMSDFSNRVSQATMLAQGKMLDVEHKLIKDSIDVYDNCESGDFRDEGFRRFEWKACAYKLELQEGAGEAMTERFMAMLGGMASSDGDPAAGGGSMGGVAGQLGMAMGAIPMFLQNLEDKVRKVRLEVTWKDAVRERQVVLERFVTSLGADPAGGPPPEDGQADLSAGEKDDLQGGNNGIRGNPLGGIRGLRPPALGGGGGPK